MLKKTVYFRTQEDLDKFNALPNKAEWLHEQLALKDVSRAMRYGDKLIVVNGVDPIKTYDATTEAIFDEEPTYTNIEETA